MMTGRPATQHTSRRRPGPDLAAPVDKAYRQAHNHAARHLLLLLTEQWLIIDRHLTLANSHKL